MVPNKKQEFLQILTLSLEPKRITAWDVYRSTPEMPSQSTLLVTVDLETKNSDYSKLIEFKNFESREKMDTKASKAKHLKPAELKDFKDTKVFAEEPWKWRTNLTGLELTCSSKDVSGRCVKHEERVTDMTLMRRKFCLSSDNLKD